ncbi:cell death abnormality protein 1-like [Saccostrea cucullata]|uniref:cell death abnormality protein 1-like n=1 Tax=Saccostrea cuccullata TaxID=36930 RepID=UPI002ED16904
MLSRALVVSLFIFVFVERIQCGRKQDGRYCLENEIFDKKSNSCTGCPPGYIGINCKKSCPAGHYGNGCQSLCPQACRKTCVFTTGKCKQPGNRSKNHVG